MFENFGFEENIEYRFLLAGYFKRIAAEIDCITFDFASNRMEFQCSFRLNLNSQFMTQ